VSGNGYAFVHTVIDDHSRVAYAEIHDDETASTATGVRRRRFAPLGWLDLIRGRTELSLRSRVVIAWSDHAR
jgi:Integrase core domain